VSFPSGSLSAYVQPHAGSRSLIPLLATVLLSILFGRASLATDSMQAATLPFLARTAIDLRRELGIPCLVDIVIVEKNDRLVSVARLSDDKKHYQISIERSFLNSLTTSEIRAAIAHELGHVWIFTHHPYLQTEDLANRIASRVVSREDLDLVYSKSEAYLSRSKSIHLVSGSESSGEGLRQNH
jgi:hypothetical protein